MNTKCKQLGNLDMSKVSGGAIMKAVYSGNTPSFSHPIKSKTLSSSKHCEDKHEVCSLSVDYE